MVTDYSTEYENSVIEAYIETLQMSHGMKFGNMTGF